MTRRSWLAFLSFGLTALCLIPRKSAEGNTRYWTVGVSRLGIDTYLAPDDYPYPMPTEPVGVNPYPSRLFAPVIAR